MTLLKNPRTYLALLLITTLGLAYTTYHYAQQRSQAVDSMVQQIDANFVTYLDQVRKQVGKLDESPDAQQLQSLQRSVSKAAALAQYTSYNKQQPYLNAVLARLDHRVVNLPFASAPLPPEQLSEWSSLLDKLMQNPADMDTLNALSLWISQTQNS
ncbi:hypothetical protein B9G55_13770 [Saccharibacillus sp. O16]|nr:hypothetical protein B9G55_13770 [Saccharibacillus sp. O16]